MKWLLFFLSLRSESGVICALWNVTDLFALDLIQTTHIFLRRQTKPLEMKVFLMTETSLNPSCLTFEHRIVAWWRKNAVIQQVECWQPLHPQKNYSCSNISKIQGWASQKLIWHLVKGALSDKRLDCRAGKAIWRLSRLSRPDLNSKVRQRRRRQHLRKSTQFYFHFDGNIQNAKEQRQHWSPRSTRQTTGTDIGWKAGSSAELAAAQQSRDQLWVQSGP